MDLNEINRHGAKVTSAGRGKNVTVMLSMSAATYLIPPLLVFFKQRLMIGTSSKSIALALPNKWMNAEFC